MNASEKEQLRKYIEQADGLSSQVEIGRWTKRVGQFLVETFGDQASSYFKQLFTISGNPFDSLAMKCGHLEGLLAKGDPSSALTEDYTPTSKDSREVVISPNTRKVFIVHGHDGEAKERVARFFEKLELEPIILHEQPNQGRTIIEKFEVSSADIAFAVVILTPDDMGRKANDPDSELRPRARQNVILELGYFFGRLGRARVVALHRGGIELPSDFQGVLYIEYDAAGAWKTKLAQELVEAKITINLQGILK